MSNPVQNFYDDFSRRLLRDYALGNPRTEAAFGFALRWLPPGGNILDLGCGIGWSSSEIHRARPSARVWGLDLSPKNIALAQILFGDTGINFTSADLTTTEAGSLIEIFDAIVMIDVYEHIPVAERAALHRRLYRLLSPDAVVILTFPSASHQQHLRESDPAGLQPVDETVGREDLETMARDLGRRVVEWRAVSVWKTGDYIHAALAPDGRGPKSNAQSTPDPAVERRERLRSRLSVRVSADGMLLSEREGAPVIGIFSPTDNSYSETFIRDQAEKLPARVRVVSGGPFPGFRDDGKNIFHPLPFPNRLMVLRSHRLLRPVAGVMLKRHWRQAGVQAVLAQYGPGGVAVMDVCRQAGLPLVVHFHGYDAYRTDVLRQYHKDYPRLFQLARAVVAVSTDMRRQLEKLGADPARIHVNPCGVDTDLFTPTTPAQNPPLFVSVGRFVDKKAPFLALLAFERTLRRFPDARLVMAGDGPLWLATRQLAKAVGIEQAVDFPGACRHYEIAQLLGRARAFIQHSVVPANGDSEGTPVALLEAGASGLPVVVTAHGGMKDVVVEGENGFLVPENDIEAMSASMVRLAEDPGLAGELGKNFRARVCEHYSSRKSLGRLFEIISSVI